MPLWNVGVKPMTTWSPLGNLTNWATSIWVVHIILSLPISKNVWTFIFEVWSVHLPYWRFIMSHFSCSGDAIRLWYHCSVFSHTIISMCFHTHKKRGREYKGVVSLWCVFHIHTNIMMFSQEKKKMILNGAYKTGFDFIIRK